MDIQVPFVLVMTNPSLKWNLPTAKINPPNQLFDASAGFLKFLDKISRMNLRR